MIVLDRKTTRRQIILAGLATLAANALVTPFAHAQAQKRLIHPHSPSPTHGRGKYTVMLDPGHGGIDSGAVGHEGSLEKHVVLEIANNVKNLLKGHGIDAFLTRTDDTFIPLYDRVQIAHAHNASLFMSIHADGFTSPAAHGASVFALSTRGASSAMAKYLAKSENAADEVAGNRAMHKDKYLDRIIFDLEQTETIKESLLLGSHIVRHISPVHPMHSRQTEQAAFVVLKSPYIPSVLVETSFITNPEEERLLGTTAFRYKIASAITNGIVSYFGRKQTVSA
ncbi:N-acetylmuramoyl-L-alanine amidase AmiA [Yokenella regensburgei]|uniref:N-acetylmuramoyl-L-alanine amidase AmiA n=1 Tax=Yokenella regensburgei TaxID=158877 RepID=UPI0027D9A08A|nr:N-acetylmuramoyl-L-alanine amidase AmiA [Yokenella regensburgei]MDQ4427984.1 N-acetylmuramoyl-L-alanine amidase AmiA [Yokenella regensburgei]